MNKNPKISVLMPAYNAEKYIAASIESIIKQTYVDFELIVVDDCSTDATSAVVEKFMSEDSRITLKRNEINLGISGTRNFLISLARGEYIVWQDADDISLPERVEKQCAFMDANPDVGICGGFLQYFNEKKNLGVRKYAKPDAELRAKIFRYSPVAQPAAIIRKSVFQDGVTYPTEASVGEDLAVTFKIGTKYKFANLQEIVLQYRVVETGATYSKLRIMELYTIFLREKYASHPSYHMTYADMLYNFLQLVSIYLVPPKIKISIFNFLRNS
jgi:glycosyltransferase involved in cell wall biosynthesis